MTYGEEEPLFAWCSRHARRADIERKNERTGDVTHVCVGCVQEGK